MGIVNTDKPITVNGKSRKWVLNDGGKGYYHYIRTTKGYYLLNQGRLNFVESSKKLEKYKINKSLARELLQPALDYDEVKTAIQENEDGI